MCPAIIGAFAMCDGSDGAGDYKDPQGEFARSIRVIPNGRTARLQEGINKGWGVQRTEQNKLPEEPERGDPD